MCLQNLKRQQYKTHAKTVSFAGTLSGVCRQNTYVLQINSAYVFARKTSLTDQVLSQQANLAGFLYTWGRKQIRLTERRVSFNYSNLFWNTTLRRQSPTELTQNRMLPIYIKLYVR